MLQAVPSVCFSTPAYPLTHCLDLKSNTIDVRPGTPEKKPELLGKKIVDITKILCFENRTLGQGLF